MVATPERQPAGLQGWEVDLRRQFGPRRVAGADGRVREPACLAGLSLVPLYLLISRHLLAMFYFCVARLIPRKGLRGLWQT